MIQQHRKCLVILGMIRDCETYISNCRGNLKRHYATRWIDQMPGVVEYNEKNIEKYKAIRERLVLSYSNQFMKMVEAVAEVMQ